MPKPGRKKMSKKMQEIRERKKARRKASYSPGDEYPTVSEAKELLRECYESRGFRVKSIQNRMNNFLVTFEESDECWTSSKKKKGGGPYGLECVRPDWHLVKYLKKKKEDGK